MKLNQNVNILVIPIYWFCSGSFITMLCNMLQSVDASFWPMEGQLSFSYALARIEYNIRSVNSKPWLPPYHEFPHEPRQLGSKQSIISYLPKTKTITSQWSQLHDPSQYLPGINHWVNEKPGHKLHGQVLNCGISIASTVEIRQYCTKHQNATVTVNIW